MDRTVTPERLVTRPFVLAVLATVNPGDEVLIPDPYFVSYPNLVTIAGGKSVYVDTYPTFHLDPERVAAAITPRTKVILMCSPSNPTGSVVTTEAMKAIAELAAKHGILLISDEIYRAFHHDGPARSPAEARNLRSSSATRRAKSRTDRLRTSAIIENINPASGISRSAAAITRMISTSCPLMQILL